MSAAGITLGFGDAALRSQLQRLVALDAARFNRATEDIGEYLVGEVQDNLDGQKLADGSAMPQSKAAQGRTTVWKRADKSKGRVKGAVRDAGKTLIHKHHLYDSYVSQLRSGGVEVGSNLVYAAIHHFGGATGRGHKTVLPARPVLGVGAKQERRIGDILLAEIKATQ